MEDGFTGGVCLKMMVLHNKRRASRDNAPRPAPGSLRWPSQRSRTLGSQQSDCSTSETSSLPRVEHAA
eukprot:scaffold20337_cov30-Tisochrysis_lutea.AAC.1